MGTGCYTDRHTSASCQNAQPTAFIVIGNRACPAKAMSKDVMLMLGMKIMSEIELSFSGFVNETANELEYAGMMLVYTKSFKMTVEELSEE